MLHDILGSFICDFVYFTHIETVGLCVCNPYFLEHLFAHICNHSPFCEWSVSFTCRKHFQWEVKTSHDIYYHVWHFVLLPCITTPFIQFISLFSVCHRHIVISNQILKPYRICSECGFLRNWHFYFYELLNNKLNCVLFQIH